MRYYINPGKILRQMFQEQTKSALHIIIWTIVFIADLFAVHYLLQHFGVSYMSHSARNLYLYALLGGGLLVFWLETFIYNKLHSLFR